MINQTPSNLAACKAALAENFDHLSDVIDPSSLRCSLCSDDVITNNQRELVKAVQDTCTIGDASKELLKAIQSNLKMPADTQIFVRTVAAIKLQVPEPGRKLWKSYQKHAGRHSYARGQREHSPGIVLGSSGSDNSQRLRPPEQQAVGASLRVSVNRQQQFSTPPVQHPVQQTIQSDDDFDPVAGHGSRIHRTVDPAPIPAPPVPVERMRSRERQNYLIQKRDVESSCNYLINPVGKMFHKVMREFADTLASLGTTEIDSITQSLVSIGVMTARQKSDICTKADPHKQADCLHQTLSRHANGDPSSVTDIQTVMPHSLQKAMGKAFYEALDSQDSN